LLLVLLVESNQKILIKLKRIKKKMPYKNIEERRKHYEKNKDEINRKRREYGKSPEVKERKNSLHKKWRIDNLDKMRKSEREYSRKRRAKEKKLVFNHYGRKCVCCGEENEGFLTIDHINGKGTEHRKNIHNQLYYWLVKNNFPEEFQTLCFNCNWGKYNNGGICPHKDKK